MKYIKYINILALAAVLYVNYLANAQPINGLTTADVSNMYPSLFTPAGITFSIWGVIYLFLIAFVFFAAAKEYSNDNYINTLFLLTCLCNMAWIFAWHHLRLGLSVVIMLTFLILLIAIFRKLPEAGGKEFWLVRVPFSIYLAWICVATVANVSALLLDIGLNPSYGGIITAIMIIVLLSVLYMVQRQQRNWPFSLVVIWALSGIIIARSWDQHAIIIITAAAGILFAVLSTVKGRITPAG